VWFRWPDNIIIFSGGILTASVWLAISATSLSLIRTATAAPDDSSMVTWAIASDSADWSGAVLPDFAAYGDVQIRKVRFFSYLVPLVRAENKRVAKDRRRLTYICAQVRWQQEINAVDRVWLRKLVEEYKLSETDPHNPDFWAAAWRRVDILPLELVLVQAANESAWGTSRFAREGNNLFGQWCFSEGCGIVPGDRPVDASYEVASFGTVRESLGSYVHNLNTGRSYRRLRTLRAEMRRQGRQLDAAELAAGLVSYSQRGTAYVAELQAMIRHNAQIFHELRGQVAKEGNS